MKTKKTILFLIFTGYKIVSELNYRKLSVEMYIVTLCPVVIENCSLTGSLF